MVVADAELGGGFRVPVVGMVGAGQLARMTHQAAIDLGVELVVLARRHDDPAVTAGAQVVYGAPDDPEALQALSGRCDVVTFDHEGVPHARIAALEAAGARVEPGSQAQLFAQDKLVARQGFAARGLPVPCFAPVGAGGSEDVLAFAAGHGWPVVLKARSGGYDGRGVVVVDGPGQAREAVEVLGSTGLLVEEHVDIAAEVALVAVRSRSGEYSAYPLVATLQSDGICTELVMPAPVTSELSERAGELARSVAESVDATGIIAVELFIDTRGKILINEIALRPHNSGHATIEACVTSQFQNHLRAVLGWPLGDTSLVAPAAAMVNVLGPRDSSDPRARLAEALAVRSASVHLYSKSTVVGRKLGHVTALGATGAEALATARRCAAVLTGA